MAQYILRRVLQMVPVLFVLSVLIFGLLQLMPGDPAEIYLGEDARRDPALLERTRRDLGLDQPLPVQYGRWLGRTLTGDLGRSITARRPVATLLGQAFPKTLQLALMTVTFALALSIPLGVLAAVRRNSIFDVLATFLATFGAAMPSFFMGVLLILLFSVTLRILPAFGYANPLEDPAQSAKLMIMPVLTLGLSATASLTRQLRSSMLSVLGNDYIQTARAKGLAAWVVLSRHALRNALIPVLTVLGIQIAVLMSGSVITESMFAIPGMGRLAVEAINTKDYPVVLAVTMIVATIVLTMNLLVDLSYSIVDPRIRVR